MPPSLDETYVPRLWRCGECKRALGVVMRDTSRIRRLWVFRGGYDAELPTVSMLRQASRGLYKVHGMDQGNVECPVCGAITEWSMSRESLAELMAHYPKVTI